MTNLRSHLARLGVLCGTLLVATGTLAQTVNLAQAPLLTAKVAPGLAMLIMGRDLTLSRAAFNDVNDIDGDGIMDTYFKPAFKYDGYFASDRCYNYNTTSAQFEPKKLATVTTGNVYECSGSGTSSATNPRWSGNFLNWLAMSRIDVIRKVLYGGKRSTDTATGTVLERSYVTQDSTLWGKEYESVTRDGYDIAKYAPLTAPSAGARHIFANVTQAGPTAGYYLPTTNSPMLLVYQGSTYRVWDIVAANKPILGMTFNSPVAPTNQYAVRIQTCVKLGTNNYESWCAGYPWGSTSPTSYKPTGVLQKYGHPNTLAFGLISGSYDNNYGGGVLRKNIDDINGEINADGTFNATAFGIIHHLSALRLWGFGVDPTDSQSPVWSCKDKYKSQRLNGECMAWGNPLGEMMFEGLNYFSGGTPTPAYTAGVGANHSVAAEDSAGNLTQNISYTSPEGSTNLNLKQPAWINPLSASVSRTRTKAYPICAKPSQVVIGNPNTSFDSDQLPGAAFSVAPGFGASFSGSFGSLNVAQLGQAIWNDEFPGGGSKSFFIGQSGTNYDGNPSAKPVSSFGDIRGHAPDDTTGQGSFYGASVARYGKSVGVVNGGNVLKVNQFSVALDSHIPRITIANPQAAGQLISIVPFSKTVGGNTYGPKNVDKTQGQWQPTGAITAFFMKSQFNTAGQTVNTGVNGGRPQYNFLISYSDADQGGDNETDAIIDYQVNVLANNQISIGINYSGGSSYAEMHMGYAIAGTSADGIYLDVGAAQANNANCSGICATALNYYLDTPQTTGAKLPVSTMTTQRVFTFGKSANGSFIPHDMLWYAAKYGSANYKANNVLDTVSLKLNGDPENYFFASNPSLLSDQIGQAFQKAATLSMATVGNSTQQGSSAISGNLQLRPTFDTTRWGGNIFAFPIDATGNLSSTPSWQSAKAQPDAPLRNMQMGRVGSTPLSITPNSWSTLTLGEQSSFGTALNFQYLTGIRNMEKQYGGTLRDRNSALGDIVNSDILSITKFDFGYTDSSYQAFKAGADPQLVAHGSNDGFFRLLEQSTGIEKFAFMPQSVLSNISNLTSPTYTHQYYVDGPTSYGHVLNGSVWRGVVTGSLGAGGKSIFAINVGATASTNSAPSVLWEYQGPEIGNILNKAIVGQWGAAIGGDYGVVAVGNGVNSTNGKASLLVFNAFTGALKLTCTPIDAANIFANGMTAVTYVAGSSGRLSYVYAADILGNIWRFDASSTTSTACSISATRVFVAKDSANKTQPITGEMIASLPPSGKSGYFITFGTGSYVSNADALNMDTQTLYGVWDDLSNATVTRSMLVPQFIKTSSSTMTRTTSTNAESNGGASWSDNSGKRGWIIDLNCSGCTSGERYIGTPALMYNGTTLVMPTYVPSTDECNAGGGAWFTYLDPLTGAYREFQPGINSVYIPGDGGRSIRKISVAATASHPAGEAILTDYTSFSGGTTSIAPGVSNQAVITNPDGSGSGTSNMFVTPPVANIKRLHRQVWRQLQ